MAAPTADIDSPAGDGQTARRVVFGALGLQLVLLTATGAVLLLEYRPAASGAIAVVQVVHRWLSVLMVPSSIAGAVALVMQGRGAVRAVTGLALVAVTLAATFTGFLLPWDQLALWAAEVGGNTRGYRWLGDDTVRFVIASGYEIGPDTVFRWLALHLALGLAAGGLVLLGALGPAFRHQRAQRSEENLPM